MQLMWRLNVDVGSATSMCNDLLSELSCFLAGTSPVETLDPKITTCIPVSFSSFLLSVIFSTQSQFPSNGEAISKTTNFVSPGANVCGCFATALYKLFVWEILHIGRMGLLLIFRSFIFTLNTLPVWTFLPSDTGFGITNKFFSVTLLAMRRFRPPWFVA